METRKTAGRTPWREHTRLVHPLPPEDASLFPRSQTDGATKNARAPQEETGGYARPRPHHLGLESHLCFPRKMQVPRLGGWALASVPTAFSARPGASAPPDPKPPRPHASPRLSPSREATWGDGRSRTPTLNGEAGEPSLVPKTTRCPRLVNGRGWNQTDGRKRSAPPVPQRTAPPPFPSSASFQTNPAPFHLGSL